MFKKIKFCPLTCILLAPSGACIADSTVPMVPCSVESAAGSQRNVVPFVQFDNPWAMTFLPDKSSKVLAGVALQVPASEIERYDMGRRFREVEQDRDGRVFLRKNKAGGRLIYLSDQ